MSYFYCGWGVWGCLGVFQRWVFGGVSTMGVWGCFNDGCLGVFCGKRVIGGSWVEERE